MRPAVAFRVDASPQIGIGHVMRCLTLADVMAAGGATVHFLSRYMPRFLLELVRARGHECTVFPATPADPVGGLPHADWLGTSQAADAADSLRALDGHAWDCVVVDHYALDAQWETPIRTAASRILVIDDVADRVHDCDLLLDQNVYPDMETRYDAKVPPHCERLIGPGYALLRPEFRRWRARSAPRRGPVERVMVCFGGVDAGDLTQAALGALHGIGATVRTVDVVVGASHPRLEATQAACAAAGYTCHVQSDRMAELMAVADLALGAAGSTSWERCGVGLPAVCVATAHNQVAIAAGLESRGVAVTVPAHHDVSGPDIAAVLAPLLADPARVASMSRAAWNLVDGLGADRVRERVLGVLCN